MASKKLEILLIDDDAADRKLVRRMLTENPFFESKITEAIDIKSAVAVLGKRTFDCILLDHQLPDGISYDVLDTLRKKMRIKIPVVVVTGTLRDNTGSLAIKRGAQEFLGKDELQPSLLGRIVLHAIERREVEVEQDRLIRDLQGSFAQIDALHDLLPICCECKQIRDDDGYWHKLESYLASHSEFRFSHGYCPICADALMKKSGIKSTKK